MAWLCRLIGPSVPFLITGSPTAIQDILSNQFGAYKGIKLYN
jgi:hypothetical protein